MAKTRNFDMASGDLETKVTNSEANSPTSSRRQFLMGAADLFFGAFSF